MFLSATRNKIPTFYNIGVQSMKLILNYFFLMTALSLLSSCGVKINSQWKTTAIEIDGHGQDWDGIPLQYNENMKIIYGIVNDEKALNFIIRFNDPSVARQFAMRGVTLWFNDENKKDKQRGIHYKEENMWGPISPGIERRGQNAFQREAGQRKAPLPTGNFTLSRKDTLTSIPVADIAGWQAAAGFADGLYTYEFQVPLKPLVNSAYYPDVTKGQKIKVGLEIPGMSKDEIEAMKGKMDERGAAGMKGSGSRGGGMSGGMRGGSRAGGMRGSGSPGGGRQMPDMDGKEVWITVTLAEK